MCSLLEPAYAYETGLYISPVFDIDVGYRPEYFETSDKHRTHECWLADFRTGTVRLSGTSDFDTLAVRSLEDAVCSLQYYEKDAPGSETGRCTREETGTGRAGESDSLALFGHH